MVSLGFPSSALLTVAHGCLGIVHKTTRNISRDTRVITPLKWEIQLIFKPCRRLILVPRGVRSGD